MKPSWGKVRIGVIATLSVAAFAIVAAAVPTVSHAQSGECSIKISPIPA